MPFPHTSHLFRAAICFLYVAHLGSANFIWPDFADSGTIKVQIGSEQTFKWTWDYSPFNLTLFQGDHATDDWSQRYLIINGTTETSYNWTVEPLNNRPLSQCFHAKLTSTSSVYNNNTTEFCAQEDAVMTSSSDVPSSIPTSTIESSAITSPTSSATQAPTASNAVQQSGTDGSGFGNNLALGVGLGLGVPIALTLGVFIGIYCYRSRPRQGPRLDEMRHTTDGQAKAPGYVGFVELNGRDQAYEIMSGRDGEKLELPVVETRQELPGR